MIDSWLVAHALPPGLSSAALEEVSEEFLEDQDEDTGAVYYSALFFQ